MKGALFSYNDVKGSSVIFVAVLLAAVMGFAALAFDFGKVFAIEANMQGAVDAAALAAAEDLPNTILATDTANAYILANGYHPADIAITFSEGNQVINIDGTKVVDYSIAPVIGLSSVTIYPAASAKKTNSLGAAFDYVLFSGATYPGGFSVRLQNVFTITGSNNVANGSAHANYRIDASGSTTSITGACAAVDTVNVGSNTGIVDPRPFSSFIPMPDFSAAKATIKAQAIAANQYYSGNFSSANAASLNVTQPVYVEGSANLSGINFSGVGCIYVVGKITITGTGTSYASNSNICMYSEYASPNKSSEAIYFGGSDKNFKGILYAPNGSISVTGSNYTFSGSVVGKVLDLAGSAKTFTKTDVSASFPYGENKVVLIR